MPGGRGLEIRLLRHLLREQPLALAVGRPVLRIWWRERGQHGQRHSLAKGCLARPGPLRWNGQQRPCGAQLWPARQPGGAPIHP